MRIIGGQARGRLIRLPARATLRPTTDRIRKSLFDILPHLPGVFFLDLFAGGGSVGLEAISRGAEKVFFVERDVSLAEAIRDNLRVLGAEAQAELIVADARKALDRFAKQAIRFDVLFADPPYDRGFVNQVCTWLSGGELLAEEGVAVIQHSVRERLACPTGALFVADQRRYGDTLLTFLTKEKV
jgi:16S rRNA (guanine(966)-N(2))-methyltransferase RsmD